VAGGFQDYVVDLRRGIEAMEEPPFVIGHSLGAAVCLAAATEVGVAGLVSIAGVYTFAQHNATLRALAQLSLHLERPLRNVRLSTKLVGRIIARLYSVTDIAGYGAPIAGWHPGSLEREVLEERLRSGFDWTSVEVWLQMCRWALGDAPPYRDAFGVLDVPLLVVAGDSDPLVTVADAEHTFASSGSTDRTLLAFDAFEHGVHWGHVDLLMGKEAPHHVWPALRSWLQER
jgi:pimeloyl-ACP methyl ester carboxylesterase